MWFNNVMIICLHIIVANQIKCNTLINNGQTVTRRSRTSPMKPAIIIHRNKRYVLYNHELRIWPVPTCNGKIWVYAFSYTDRKKVLAAEKKIYFPDVQRNFLTRPSTYLWPACLCHPFSQCMHTITISIKTSQYRILQVTIGLLMMINNQCV